MIIVKYEVLEDKNYPEQWRVEFVLEETCYTVIFKSPDAESRAREYVAFQEELDDFRRSRAEYPQRRRRWRV